MTIKAYVVNANKDDGRNVKVDEDRLKLLNLGAEIQSLSLGDVLSAMIEPVESIANGETELTIELSAAPVVAGANSLVLNIAATEATTLKLTLKTKIWPRRSQTPPQTG